MRKFAGSIALTKMKHVIKKMKNRSGQLVDVIILPIDANYLVRDTKGRVYIDMNIILHDEPDQYNQDGFMPQKIPTDIWKNATEEQRQAMQKDTPILGNFIDVRSLNNDNSGALPASEFQPIPEEENDGDLPF